MTSIGERLQALQTRIHDAEIRAGRLPGSVQLLAVSKAHTADSIRAAFSAGQIRFGENYLQEALDKQLALQDLPIEWHFIGPIQSNKTQSIAHHFDWVHSVDRIKIAQRLAAARGDQLSPLNVCLQLNVSAEASKSGVDADGLIELATLVNHLPQLRLRGIMAIPAPTKDEAQQRAQFRRVRESFEQLKDKGFALDTLSMGMSDDFPAAIAEGANIIRVGSAIFGARPSVANTVNQH